MLQLDHICKSYVTSSFTQVALDDVSLAFRDNEFVSILGTSGSGKTTMLNVIGGLDHFDSGDLLIDGISTQKYKDRDWDAYRNNRIGFVFQSYNLIPHQTILANVELALTLSGVSASERRERARQALVDVGLGEHVDKRPSQLSGGQMQRVAIARALINDPEILLADEPTGALDSRTSVQVMDLLRQVADDRLVIMVTHNPDLAYEYSTRIVELVDGRIRSDSDPFEPQTADLREAKPPRRTSMSFLTALSLSFNNLMTKKGRTLMTAFAGSIGIIGIAAILSLANGVNAYIKEVEEETLSVYPLQIMSSGFDMTSMITDLQAQREDLANDEGGKRAGQSVRETRMVGSMFGSLGKNDLGSLKEYLDANGGGIRDSVQDIEYMYDVTPQIFISDANGKPQQVNPDSAFESIGMTNSSPFASGFSMNTFRQMPADLSLVEGQFDVRAGRWPEARDELVVVLSPQGSISDLMSYQMGLRDHKELDKMMQSVARGDEVEDPDDALTFSTEELLSRTFKVVPAAQLFVHDDSYDVWTQKNDDEAFVADLVNKAMELKVVGIMQRREDVDASTISMGIYYTPELTNWLMERAADSAIVKEQRSHKDINVLSGKPFSEEKSKDKNLDMSTLFDVDKDKIGNAFKFDEDKLDLSEMDFSDLANALDFSNLADSLDLSSISMPDIDPASLSLPLDDLANINLDLSGIDFSSVDLSGIDLSGIDTGTLLSPEVVAALAPDVSSIDVAALFKGITPDIDQAALASTISKLQVGLARYLAEHPVDPTDQSAMSDAVAAYLATDEARQVMAELANAVTFSDEDRRIIAQRLQEQIRVRSSEEAWNSLDEQTRTRLGEDAQKVVGQLAQRVAAQVGEAAGAQVADALTTQLGGALSSTISAVLESIFSESMSAYFSGIANELQNQLVAAIESSMTSSMERLMRSMGENMANAISIDENAFAQAFSLNMTEKQLAELMQALMGSQRSTYSTNLTKMGYADPSTPSEIDIYPLDFDAKARVIEVLDSYNADKEKNGEEDKAITYTDLVGALMSSVTEIVNMISYVLIAFVAISLIVSSIMIGVITYISVLERRKEIGILRSIGASKGDVSRVFNAETVIEGLVSGLMGVGITALACIPANIIVEANFDVHEVARLPLAAAIILVGVSVVLSFVAGLLPARKAAKADPVEALRSE